MLDLGKKMENIGLGSGWFGVRLLFYSPKNKKEKEKKILKKIKLYESNYPNLTIERKKEKERKREKREKGERKKKEKKKRS